MKVLPAKLKCEKIIYLLLFASLLLTPVLSEAGAAPPPPIFTPPPNYMSLVYGRVDGPPATVDPAFSGDAASDELVSNTYETLFTFDAEHVDRYIPQLATGAIRVDINETSPEGLNWTCRYVFPIQNVTVPFHPTQSNPSIYTLSPEDVEYTFERAMIYDRAPQMDWLYLALTNTSGVYYLISRYGNATAGMIIDHSVESNATHVWFNLVNAYPILPQIASTPSFGVVSRAWMHDYVINILGRPDWNGDWGDYTTWPQFYYATLDSPLDIPTPLMCGTGPYKLSILDDSSQYYTLTRNIDYWRGWPADWPSMSGTRPAGYVQNFTVTWDGNLTKFLTGEDDLYDVPEYKLDQVVGQPGIRYFSYALPTFGVRSGVFQFNVPIDSRYQKVYPSGVFAADGIPTDFFGNDTWGMHTRRAFAYSFNYTDFLINALGGNASQPATPVLPGVPYWNQTQEKYGIDLMKATNEFQQVPGLWQTGFEMVLIYPVGTPEYLAILTNLKANVEHLNPLFHLDIMALPWWVPPPRLSYLDAIEYKQVAVFFPYWDFGGEPVDPHYFLYYLMCSQVNWGGYNNTYADNLLDIGIRTTDPNLRNLIYGELQSIYHKDVPSIPIAQLYRHHVERDWVVDWYYNPAWPAEYSAGNGIYAYHLWKWYYLAGDVNYDGSIDMRDIGAIARAFGSHYTLPLDTRWNFRCDLNHDGKVDMKDIGSAARGFGKKSPVWSPVWPP